MKDDIAKDTVWRLKVISGTVNSLCLKNTAYMTYEVSYNGQTSYMRSYFFQ